MPVREESCGGKNGGSEHSLDISDVTRYEAREDRSVKDRTSASGLSNGERDPDLS